MSLNTISIKMISSFGEKLRFLRDQNRLTLREVSEVTGIDTSLLGKFERDERQPTKEQIKLIAKFYKYEEKQLIQELISDQVAYKILDADADIGILRIAEQKIEYLKNKKI